MMEDTLNQMLDAEALVGAGRCEHTKADYIEGEIYEESGPDGEPPIVIGIINLGNVLLSEMGDRLDEYDT